MIILDTNVLISAMLFSGKEAMILKYALNPNQLVFSTETAEELFRTSAKNKFEKYLNYEKRYIFVQALVKQSHMAIPLVSCTLCRDPLDNKFLEVALASNAEYLITGDKDLLVLQSIGVTKIVTPSEFLEIQKR